MNSASVIVATRAALPYVLKCCRYPCGGCDIVIPISEMKEPALGGLWCVGCQRRELHPTSGMGRLPLLRVSDFRYGSGLSADVTGLSPPVIRLTRSLGRSSLGTVGLPAGRTLSRLLRGHSTRTRQRRPVGPRQGLNPALRWLRVSLSTPQKGKGPKSASQLAPGQHLGVGLHVYLGQGTPLEPNPSTQPCGTNCGPLLSHKPYRRVCPPTVDPLSRHRFSFRVRQD
jgi:hypothetical protein